VTNKKNLSRATATQAEKAITFARAYESIKVFQQKGELLSAYVIGFSILEDRIRAMYVVRYRKENRQVPLPKNIYQGITRVMNYLVTHGDITKDAKESFELAANSRNKIIHTAMWRPDPTTPELVDSIVSLGRQAESFRRKQKKKLAKTLQR